MKRSDYRSLFLLLCLTVIIYPTFAEGTIESRVTVHFGGGAGKFLNRFGGATTKDGAIHKTAILERRMIETTGDMGQLIDLDEELHYDVNLAKKRYSTRPFSEVKEQMEALGGLFNGGASSATQDGSAEVPEIQFVAEVEFGPTGNSAKVGGYEAEEFKLVVTVHQEGMTLEEGGGGVLTALTMLGPKLAVFDETQQFRLDYLSALGLEESLQSAGGKLMQILSAAPALRAAMENFEEHQGKLEGAPLKTTLELETVALPTPETAAAVADSDDEGIPTSGRKMLGKFSKKLFKKNRENQTAKENGGRKLMFRSTTEVLSVSSSSQGLTRLADYKER